MVQAYKLSFFIIRLYSCIGGALRWLLYFIWHDNNIIIIIIIIMVSIMLYRCVE